MNLSVIIPTLNEEKTIAKTLDAISRLVNVDEVVIVDGGSTDGTIRIIEEYGGTKPVRLIRAEKPGRGSQLDEGTRNANGDAFWFLHADTRPVQGSARLIKQYLKRESVAGGNFQILFDGPSRWARFLTWLYPQLRAIGLVYGDSAMFTSRAMYEKAGGFKDLPLFEDVDLFHRLQKLGEFVTLQKAVTTSSRRFQNKSFPRIFAKWSLFQTLYWAGVPPRVLAKYYKAVR